MWHRLPVVRICVQRLCPRLLPRLQGRRRGGLRRCGLWPSAVHRRRRVLCWPWHRLRSGRGFHRLWLQHRGGSDGLTFGIRRCKCLSTRGGAGGSSVLAPGICGGGRWRALQHLATALHALEPAVQVAIAGANPRPARHARPCRLPGTAVGGRHQVCLGTPHTARGLVDRASVRSGGARCRLELRAGGATLAHDLGQVGGRAGCHRGRVRRKVRCCSSGHFSWLSRSWLLSTGASAGC
mmetsp:Transcript_90978/g.253235  ORF Transcript_90978/g.253235 Transcript_90978/m.253235 type:complete len:238 (+) Transcript_90978:1706-2419(+)